MSMSMEVNQGRVIHLFRNAPAVGIVAFSLFFVLFSHSASAAFDGGTGTVNDPYQISTCVQLQDMESGRSSYYVLNGDVDCSASSGWNGGAGFVPVGANYNAPFTGGFEGNNHTVSGLYINRPSTDNVGLFGYVMSSTSHYVQNLKLSDVAIVGRDQTGPLAGTFRSMPARNVSVIGPSSVSGNQYIGGLAGYQYDGITHNASSNATLVGSSNFTGGLFGGSWNSSYIYSSYATGAVSGTSYVGGLVGYSYTSGSRVYYSYATGAVSGSGSYVGGLVGYMYGGSVFYSYAAGSVSGVGTYGGLVGSKYGTILGSHWDVYRTGQAACYSGGSSGCTGQNSANSDPNYWFNTSSSPPFDVWDFNGLWTEVPAGHPAHESPTVVETTPIVVTTDTTPSYTFTSGAAGAITYGGDCSSATASAASGSNTVTFAELALGVHSNCTVSVGGTTLAVSGFEVISGFAGGSGTSGDPYQISTCAQLQHMRSSLSSYYVLNGDVDCGVAPWNSGSGFQPVGNSTSYLTKGLNGAGYTISGLYINRPVSDYVGLLGYAYGSGNEYLQGIRLSDVDITGKNFVGALAGYVRYFKTQNVSVVGSSSVSCNASCGGLVGYTRNNTINNVSSAATVTSSGGTYSTSGTGGLFGYLSDSSVYSSYTTGSVNSLGIGGGGLGR